MKWLLIHISCTLSGRPSAIFRPVVEYDDVIGDVHHHAHVVLDENDGTGEQIADELTSLFLEHACDGFMVSPAYLPGGFDDFVRDVVPPLQEQGLFRRAYEGATLRENLRG
ncbi:MAG: hypothetical protein KIS79_06045 [Burkholderiales bacterium]|nr:hypothetical protein [Burkholderiales bacterium]